MDDMDDLFPGTETKKEKTKKDKKSTFGDFFKTHNTGNNLMNIFTNTNTDENKITDNNENVEVKVKIAKSMFNF